ncbi:MAG: trypsin-like peptidase domain-containing protein [Verrucomicrobiales bacterium]|nr:trypsin-like peptidase domain-containing protein [Verrucomicrobiales bacterium]
MTTRLACLIPVAVSAILLASCSDPRRDFAMPDPLPLYQVIVDKESTLGGERDPAVSLRDGLADIKTAHQTKSSKSMRPDISAGLMVPVSADGFCLTAAHNLPKGESFTIVDLAAAAPRFLIGANGGTPLISTIKGAESNPGDLSRAEVREWSLEAISGPLTTADFQLVQSELAELDTAYLIPLQVIKIWKGEDLALVRVPFPTPSHFVMAEEPVPAGEPILCIGNPLVHEGTLTHVAKSAAVPPSVKFTGEVVRELVDFYPLIFSSRGLLKKGDSGGPAINRKGELVGIHSGTGNDDRHRALDVCIGIRAEVIRRAIDEWQAAAAGEGVDQAGR